MKKMGELREFLTDVSNVPYPVKTARNMVRMWAAVVLMNVTTTGMVLIAPDPRWWTVVVNFAFLVFDATMLKRMTRKLAEARKREEEEEFLTYMFRQWA